MYGRKATSGQLAIRLLGPPAAEAYKNKRYQRDRKIFIIMRAPLALVFFLLISTNQVWTKFSQLSDVEARIYKELENAIDNIIILDTLRNVLVEASESGIIQLLLNITVDYIPSVNCNYSSWYEEAAFCKLKSGIWTLCTRDPLSINWTSTSQTSEWMNGFTYYTVPLYGNFLSICIAEALGTSMDSLNPDHYFISPTMKLNITSLNCNPSKSQFCNGIGEFFTWVSTKCSHVPNC